MTLRASKGKEELPGWEDNIDFDQEEREIQREREGERERERERKRETEGGMGAGCLQDIKLSTLPQIKITTLDGNENFN